MAGAKEIRSKIASVQNTQKITKAMEMVAASKMRKSQDRMAVIWNISTLTWKTATLNAWATWWCRPTVVCAVV